MYILFVMIFATIWLWIGTVIFHVFELGFITNSLFFLPILATSYVLFCCASIIPAIIITYWLDL